MAISKWPIWIKWGHPHLDIISFFHFYLSISTSASLPLYTVKSDPTDPSNPFIHHVTDPGTKTLHKRVKLSSLFMVWWNQTEQYHNLMKHYPFSIIHTNAISAVYSETDVCHFRPRSTLGLPRRRSLRCWWTIWPPGLACWKIPPLEEGSRKHTEEKFRRCHNSCQQKFYFPTYTPEIQTSLDPYEQKVLHKVQITIVQLKI